MITRRQALKMSFAGLTAGVLPLSKALAGACGLVTPPQTEGPFYPQTHQADEDSDLTFVNGKPGTALGQVIFVRGQVTDDVKCQPVPGVTVEIWQACASGRYNHPGDTDNPAPLDPNFQYWGHATTDTDGNYMFKTVRPGSYPAGEGWIRPSHIHYKVHKTGFHELTTQMYFEGDQYNAADKILQQLKPEEQKQVVVKLRYSFGAETQECDFNIVLKPV